MRNEKGQFVKGNSGFWKNKKRPELVNTGSSKTMFRKGNSPPKHKNMCTCFRCTRTPWNKGKDTLPRCKDCGKKLVNYDAVYCKFHVKTEERSPMWKGEEVGYSALHKWVHKKRGSPKKCEHCGTREGKAYHWANKSRKYKRRLDDWIRLCVICHSKYDRNFRKNKLFFASL